jgi:hypothetical protein
MSHDPYDDCLCDLESNWRWFLGARVIGYDYKTTLTSAFVNENDGGINRVSTCSYNSNRFNPATSTYSDGTGGFSSKLV